MAKDGEFCHGFATAIIWYCENGVSVVIKTNFTTQDLGHRGVIKCTFLFQKCEQYDLLIWLYEHFSYINFISPIKRRHISATLQPTWCFLGLCLSVDFSATWLSSAP